MNKKTIEIIIIVVMFSGAGVILYNGFFKGKSQAPAYPLDLLVQGGMTGSASPTGATSDAVLPYGNKFSFKFLSADNLSYNFEKIQVNPTEIGKDPNLLLVPLSSSTSTPQ